MLCPDLIFMENKTFTLPDKTLINTSINKIAFLISNAIDVLSFKGTQSAWKIQSLFYFQFSGKILRRCTRNIDRDPKTEL